MKLASLAFILENKYNFTSFGQDEGKVLHEVKKIIKNAFMLYVNGATAKEPILQKLADANEPYSKALVSSMTKLVNELDNLSPKQIFNRLNKIASSVYQMTQDHELAVRNSIHNSVRANREPEVNFREYLKSKFGMALYRLSGQLVDATKLLANNLGIKSQTASKIPLPPPKSLGKDQHLRFLYGPKAKEVGIDSLELLEKFLHTNRGPHLLDEYIRSKSLHPPVAEMIKNIVQKLKDASSQTMDPETIKTDNLTPEQLFQEDVEEESAAPQITSASWHDDMYIKYNHQSLTDFLRNGF